jgi:hypothetical protein
MVEISRRCSSRHGVQASPQQQLALNARNRGDFGSLTAIQKAATRSTKGEGMKSIRLLILLLAGGVFTLNASFAQAQAEIDPDHYEPPIHHVQAQPSPHASHHGQTNRMVASRHASKSHHHHSHASA